MNTPIRTYYTRLVNQLNSTNNVSSKKEPVFTSSQPIKPNRSKHKLNIFA